MKHCIALVLLSNVDLSPGHKKKELLNQEITCIWKREAKVLNHTSKDVRRVIYLKFNNEVLEYIWTKSQSHYHQQMVKTSFKC